MNIRFNNYKFRDAQERHYGVNISREAFPSHNKTVFDFVVNYGKGCAYMEVKFAK